MPLFPGLQFRHPQKLAHTNSSASQLGCRGGLQERGHGSRMAGSLSERDTNAVTRYCGLLFLATGRTDRSTRSKSGPSSRQPRARQKRSRFSQVINRSKKGDLQGPQPREIYRRMAFGWFSKTAHPRLAEDLSSK